MRNSQLIIKPTTDVIFSWQCMKYHIECQCRLRIYHLTFDKYLVIISPVPDYPSASSTYSLQNLVHQISYCYNLPPTKTMWVEHYPATELNETDFYYQLLANKHNVSLFEISQDELQMMIQRHSNYYQTR